MLIYCNESDGSIRVSSRALFEIGNFLPTNSAFWLSTAGVVFTRMLEEASYSIDLKRSYICLFIFCVIPELYSDSTPLFCDSPTGYALVTTREATGTIAGRVSSHIVQDVSAGKSDSAPGVRHPTYPSYMTDDHSPIEFSCIYSADRLPTVRFSIDPLKRQQESEPALHLIEHFATLLSLSLETDLAWCRVCAETLVISENSASMPTSLSHPSQYFIGFDLSRKGTGLKAYFLTETCSAVYGVSKTDVVSSLVDRLSAIPGMEAPNIYIAWCEIKAFFQLLPQHLQPSLEIVAVDCVPSHANRLKIYFCIPLATLSTIRRVMTLDSTLQLPDVEKTLEWVTLFWRLLFPNITDDEEPSVELARLRHPTSGLLFYFDLRPDHTKPSPKVYIPVRHLCRNDGDIIHAVTCLYDMLGFEKARDSYGHFVRNTFVHKRMETKTGVHTYVSFAAKQGDAEITAYFNPECFSSEGPV
ncbi:hypothetical protein POSPLADRAFT_1043520 [Postia placenta MAD-698-R-SB12]|uniref:Aromatic prenyltransferase n=1 Tax=Postia placenta MAD-698-R-SB12 TaxID=670580 RepID=A0A1X6NBG3_9APHY|nr:hypothetical protein POSPLADRAFT_1043520 [Postia placenta MAD-698-R-SB12]OSX65978.1 hypothetical protein POSPLADRAFT_1043520 [Postia placenta MAD-698-R-SB12]